MKRNLLIQIIFVDISWNFLKTPSDYLPLFKDQKPKFKAGERFSYSNGAFVFLGILIERLSGQTFREYIHKNVLLPAKMKKSGFYAFNELPANTAFGYKEDRKTINIYNLPIRGGDAGVGFYSGYLPKQKICINIISNVADGEEELRDFVISKLKEIALLEAIY